MQETSTLKTFAADLCDEHGGALHSLAFELVRDPFTAEAAVTASICSAAGQPSMDRPASDVRRELASQVYRKCTSGPGRRANDEQALVAALVRHGCLDYRQVAELTGISAATVASLLSQALRESARN